MDSPLSLSLFLTVTDVSQASVVTILRQSRQRVISIIVFCIEPLKLKIIQHYSIQKYLCATLENDAYIYDLKINAS